jgi:hypothetical protein
MTEKTDLGRRGADELVRNRADILHPSEERDQDLEESSNGR